MSTMEMRTSSRDLSTIALMQLICIVTGLIPLILFPAQSVFQGMHRALVSTQGVCAFLILLLPVLFRKRYDVFEPLSFALLTVLFGITLRAIYMATFDNDNIRDVLLFGKRIDDIILGGNFVIFSIAFFVMGYMIRFPVIDFNRFSIIRKDNWNTPRLFIVIGFLLLVSVLCIIIYVKNMGIATLMLSNISTKHSFVVSGADYKYSSLSYYRWGASLAQPAFFLFLTWFSANRKSWVSPAGAFCVFLGLLSAVFPIFNSSRSDVVTIFIMALVLVHYVRREIPVKLILWAMVLSVVLILAMSALRKKPSTMDEIMPYFTGEKALEIMVGNQNFFGIDKAAHIVAAVPGHLEYQYGTTLVSWLVAPIPRTLWPQKPVIAMGGTIGQYVYGSKDLSGKGGGIPPGYAVELYCSFGYLGVMGGMFLLGCFLKFLYQSARPFMHKNKNAVLLYVPVMISFSFDLLGGCVSVSVIGALTQIIPITFALMFIQSGAMPHETALDGAKET